MDAQLLPRWSYRSVVMSPLHDLHATARFVLVALDNYRSEKSPVPFPSQKTLAGDTNLNETTVRSALAQAEEFGWCRRVPRYRTDGKGGRLTDGYQLTVPDGLAGKIAAKWGLPGIDEGVSGEFSR